MKQPIVQVDAFADRPFAGNPAAVCILPEPRDDAWMQSVASEMNLSETAFLHKQDDGYRLRWFTPAAEVDRCGHATLASAHALWEDGHLDPQEQARFHTRSGLLTARRAGEWIELDLPALRLTQDEAPIGLLEALSGASSYVGRTRVDIGPLLSRPVLERAARQARFAGLSSLGAGRCAARARGRRPRAAGRAGHHRATR